MFFSGVMPALCTPLHEDESVNTKVVEQLIEYFLGQGADGFYIAGATGEGLALRPDERRILAETAINAVNGRKPCIVQVASTDFSEAIRLAKHAEQSGAAAISATPPLFFRYDENDVYNYYKALADAVHIPLMVYNSPLAGFPLTPDFIAKLFKIDNITSIKWTSSDYYGLMKLKQLTNGEINVMNGPDEMLLMGLSAGADGGIGATYNFMFPLFRGIYDNFKSGNMEMAKKYQDKVTQIITALRSFTTIPCAKALLEEVGFEMGNATFPMKRYNAEQKKELVKAMRAGGWTDGEYKV
ncbi:MAG: dihydrodipicolinate synthase family protein [Clostridia bacterium]|nr:dihydrodipicolinate synthase family protein [Clostridia bacterium]